MERNVDVLVQLLQSGGCLFNQFYLVLPFIPRWRELRLNSSAPCPCQSLFSPDEPAEVAVVKTALIQHLELDSKITLSVLCDQIVPPDDPTEDEDKVIRERLRALVVAFLAEDARKPLLVRLQGQGESGVEQEQALIDTLLKVTVIPVPTTPHF